MNRRRFFASLLAGVAAPLIARPTLEEIERLSWRRQFFPAWGRCPPRILTPEFITRETLEVLEAQLQALHFHPSAFVYVVPKIGEPIHVRKPRPFLTTLPRS